MALRWLALLWPALPWLALLAPRAAPCLLCPYRTPPFPKPLDQFRLPSLEKLMHTSGSVAALCRNGTR